MSPSSWLRANEPPDFEFVRQFKSSELWHSESSEIVPFPFTHHSSKTLWGGLYEDSDALYNAISQYQDMVVITGQRQCRLYNISTSESTTLNFPQPKDITLLPADGVCATWAIRTPDMTVFLILAYGLFIYVFDVGTKRFITTLCGHGNTITSLALDATKPNIFASTSRDFSTRIYDLSQRPRQISDPVPTPHRGRVSMPSEALGHDVAGGEGDPTGVGRCILVLMGQGYSDNAFPVLQADFHPTLPLIATCSMDRTVRIWHLPACLPLRPLRQIHRPLFSSANIHPSAPLSIHWVGIDILCSHSAPVEKRYSEQQQGGLYVWKWLALSTYFPEGWEDEDQTRILCPSAKDLRLESACYKILSTISPALPHLYFRHLSFAKSEHHDPAVMLLYPSSNVSQVTPVHEAFVLNISRSSKGYPKLTLPQSTAQLPTRSPHRKVVLRFPEGVDVSRQGITCCKLIADAEVLLGAGMDGTLWVWVNNTPVSANDSFLSVRTNSTA